MNLTDIRNQLIYISALDWGWGHVSRTCAIIKKLYPHNDIVIFSTQDQSKFYSKIFPGISQVLIPSYNIQFYPSSIWKNIFLIPQFFKAIKQENVFLSKYLQNNRLPDLIISDNRYGFYHPQAKNIIVCHQVELQLPYFFYSINRIHQNLLNTFDEIWIPDYKEEERSLAGYLSHPSIFHRLDAKLNYILPQTLMKKYDATKEIDYLFIISGTASERVYYEEKFMHFAKALLRKNVSSRIHIIGGIQQDNELLLGWRDSEEINHLMLQSKNIITRAGYSTLMDLACILTAEQNVYFFHSNYQYEQKYLCNYWINKNYAKSINTMLIK